MNSTDSESAMSNRSRTLTSPSHQSDMIGTPSASRDRRAIVQRVFRSDSGHVILNGLFRRFPAQRRVVAMGWIWVLAVVGSLIGAGSMADRRRYRGISVSPELSGRAK